MSEEGERHLRWVDTVDGRLRAVSTSVVAALPTAGVGIVVQDAAASIVAANARAELLLGLPFDALIGRTSTDPRWAAVGESGMPLPGREHPAMQTLASGGAVTGFLMGVLVPSNVAGLPGHSRWIEVSTCPVVEGDDLLGVVVAFSDAAASPRAEIADDRLREAYRLLAENAYDVVSRTSPDGVLEWVTPSIERMTGWTPEEVVGRPSQDFVHPADREALLASRRRVDETGRDRIEVRLLRRDGGSLWVVLRAEVLLGVDGRVIGRIASWTDIDHTVRAREEMARSERRFRTLAQNATDLVVESRGDGTISWASSSVSAVLGVDVGELGGTTLEDLVHPDDREVASMVLAGRTPDGSDTVLLRLVGPAGERWYSCRPALPVAGEETLLALRDVDELVRARAEADRDRAFLRETLNALPDPHSLVHPVVDGSGVVTDLVVDLVNAAALRYLGLSDSDVIGRLASHVFPQVFAAEAWPDVHAIFRPGEPVALDDLVDPLPGPDGRPRWIDLRVTPAGDGWSITWRDVSERHRTQAHLADLALHDPLTGLANRAALEDVLRRERDRPADGRSTALLMVDLDRFKEINDSHGHAVGDAVLREAAARLTSAVRSVDLVARWGGDEFIVLLTDLETAAAARHTADRILDRFRSPCCVADREIDARVSIGIALAVSSEDVGALLEHADAALYAAKESGRDRTEVAPSPEG